MVSKPRRTLARPRRGDRCEGRRLGKSIDLQRARGLPFHGGRLGVRRCGARASGHHTLLAGIAADQRPSVRLHEKFGFVEVARMRELGWKFDRWLDVIFMQKML
jgi:L-amino acid N-acyltransferase